MNLLVKILGVDKGFKSKKNFTPLIKFYTINSYCSHVHPGCLLNVARGTRYRINFQKPHPFNYERFQTQRYSQCVVYKDSECDLQERLTFSISYEKYWTDEQIRELEETHPELFVRGIVYIPAFATSDAKLLVSQHIDDGNLCTEKTEFKVFGFIARNRAFNGDEVVGFRSRRQKNETGDYKITKNECRIIKISKRTPTLNNFVCSINLPISSEGGNLKEGNVFIRCQPRDTRWPAFKINLKDMDEDIRNRLLSIKESSKLLSLAKFTDWDENEIEPRGLITKIIGTGSDPFAQMESIIFFHGLNANGFSKEVLDNLTELIREGNEKRMLNRKDYRDLFVLSIDPQDAKDLDDALSVQVLEDGSRIIYRIGIHIADVSHYVKTGSLVDLDARERATSVYLEHRVYPMLPRELSENLCSLLPDSEKLCFSVFVDLVEDSIGEKVGIDLYIRKNANFELTNIISKCRLSYETGKDILSSALKGANPDLFKLNFKDFEEEVGKHNFDNTQKSLLRLYFIAKRLRYYRLKQLGAVHVDIDGSTKCHIPMIGDLKNLELRIEYIPRESHELIEEMMLLANTQAAKLLSRKFDKYFLRVHENTSKEVKSIIIEMLPEKLKNIINPHILDVPQILRKCQKYMEATAFQSLSFIALQKFREAIYSPTNKSNDERDDTNYCEVTGHWGLALPVYLHFTSPIRRYSDLHTHHMLKSVLYGYSFNNSIKLLTEICQQCNIQKRRAFDAQKEYKNFAFNQYLSFISKNIQEFTEEIRKKCSFTQSHTGAQENESWGYLYKDACVSAIINPHDDKLNGKTSIVFYIPLLNEQKSTSCDVLNIKPISARYANCDKQNINCSILDSYYNSQKPKIEELTTAIHDQEVTFKLYQRTSVVLVPGTAMWTLRLPAHST